MQYYLIVLCDNARTVFHVSVACFSSGNMPTSEHVTIHSLLKTTTYTSQCCLLGSKAMVMWLKRIYQMILVSTLASFPHSSTDQFLLQ